MNLGEYIRQLRDSKDLSLREFAARIDVSPAFISDIEHGRRSPSKKVLEAIADFFSIKIDELEKYDHRVPIQNMKDMIRSNPDVAPAWGVALRKAKEKKLTTKELRDLLDQIHGNQK